MATLELVHPRLLQSTISAYWCNRLSCCLVFVEWLPYDLVSSSLVAVTAGIRVFSCVVSVLGQAQGRL